MGYSLAIIRDMVFFPSALMRSILYSIILHATTSLPHMGRVCLVTSHDVTARGPRMYIVLSYLLS